MPCRSIVRAWSCSVPSLRAFLRCVLCVWRLSPLSQIICPLCACGVLVLRGAPLSLYPSRFIPVWQLPHPRNWPVRPPVELSFLSKCREIASISGSLSLNKANFVKAFSPHFNRIDLKCPAPVQSWADRKWWCCRDEFPSATEVVGGLCGSGDREPPDSSSARSWLPRCSGSISGSCATRGGKGRPVWKCAEV